MTTVLLSRNGAQYLRGDWNVIAVSCFKAYSSSADNKQAYNLAQLKRGTGGRSSFNGWVATVFGNTGFVGRGSPYDPLRLKLCGDLGQVYFHPYHLCDEESIAKVLKYSNVVINLIGSDWETRNFKYDDVHVEGARRIARLSKEAGVTRLIHFSALNATKTPKALIKKGGSQFLASKARGEEAVLAEFPDATIFRPADIYGQEDRFLRYYAHFWRRQLTYMPLWHKGEKTIKQPVHVSDVAAGVIAALKDPDSVGKIYQAVGPRRYYLSELVDWFFRIMHKDERWGYWRYDMRYDPTFWAKVNITEFIRTATPIAGLHWDRVEREHITDDLDIHVPTLEDLGVNLTKMEDQVPWELKPWIHGLYQGLEADDEPWNPPTPPKCVA